MTFPIPNVAADDWLANMRAIVDQMPAVLDRHPDARIVRNQVGNLSILDHGINLFADTDDQAGS